MAEAAVGLVGEADGRSSREDMDLGICGVATTRVEYFTVLDFLK